MTTDGQLERASQNCTLAQEQHKGWRQNTADAAALWDREQILQCMGCSRSRKRECRLLLPSSLLVRAPASPYVLHFLGRA